MKFEQIEYILPDFWAGYFINGEHLEDNDQDELEKWLECNKKDILDGHWDIKTDESGELEEASFYYSHDASFVGILGCNCFTYIFNKRVKLANVSNSLKRRFVKDSGLNINVFSEPYFQLSLELYEKDFQSLSKYEKEFLPTLRELGNESLFIEESEKVTNKVKLLLQDRIEYGRFISNNTKDITDRIKELEKGKIFRALYHMDNVDFKYVSIDMKQANFNIFKSLGIIPKEYKDYVDLIDSQTDYEYFSKSKYTRQVIFGHLNPKRARTYMKLITLELLNSLPKDIQDKVITFNTDEIVFKVESEKEAELIYDSVYKDEVFKFDFNGYSFPLNVSTFDLYSIKDKKEKAYYYKDYGYKQELKGVPSMFYIQYYKYLNKMEILETDKVFYYEGEIASFRDSVFDKKD